MIKQLLFSNLLGFYLMFNSTWASPLCSIREKIIDDHFPSDQERPNSYFMHSDVNNERSKNIEYDQLGTRCQQWPMI